ncbi:hypothetical protein [Aquimarina sp. 2201CG5-10]|uniref:hypothetical protein n=1 Tax=Aquimarina callyspongiae TaxID=3098150 RepID=UPI002AB4EDE6|nr:hypothetical protein [Aquimarina sp. 2201CG5-10]MDY8134772.1 hypothetical protein [Aquimarina sp. 2201CG5-10]
MNKINLIVGVLVLSLVFSCDTNDATIQIDNSLASLVAVNSIEIDNVIACASGSKDEENTIIAYAYPRDGATDLRYYETASITDDKNNYQNYNRILIEPEDFFNGYLKKFTRITEEEKWVIITFFENNKLHLSNPIRLKHLTKPTEFTDAVSIDMSQQTMPSFMWEDGIIAENKIYFQVISDVNNDLLSGTYTFEKEFQYYKLDNVVLNITQETPPQLNPMNSYNFTLMGVSEDNWVNLFIERNFTLNP